MRNGGKREEPESRRVFTRFSVMKWDLGGPNEKPLGIRIWMGGVFLSLSFFRPARLAGQTGAILSEALSAIILVTYWRLSAFGAAGQTSASHKGGLEGSSSPDATANQCVREIETDELRAIAGVSKIGLLVWAAERGGRRALFFTPVPIAFMLFWHAPRGPAE
jgi:hypothetical protein